MEEGTVLYTIDSSDAANSLEQAEISLSQSERSYQNTMETLEDLYLTAPVSGRVYSIDVEVGDEVSAGETVATIQDSDTMSLEVTFPADDAASFSVGQSATVTLDSRTGREVLAMLQDIHRQGNTVVLITHDNSIAVQAQRIIRLEDGHVVYDGPSDAPEAVVTPRAAGGGEGRPA